MATVVSQLIIIVHKLYYICLQMLFTLMDMVFLQGLEWTKELRTMMLLCTCSLILRGDLQQNLLYLAKVYTTIALSAFGEIYSKGTTICSIILKILDYSTPRNWLSTIRCRLQLTTGNYIPQDVSTAISDGSYGIDIYVRVCSFV